jgi:hypothetical protein
MPAAEPDTSSESTTAAATTFTPIQYDPTTQSTSTSSRHRTELPTHRLHPYSRAPSTGTTSSTLLTSSSLPSESTVSHGDKKRTKRLCLGDLDSGDREAIAWARIRMVMDLVASKGWMKNDTAEEKELMNVYLGEIVAQANSSFKRGKC